MIFKCSIDAASNSLSYAHFRLLSFSPIVKNCTTSIGKQKKMKAPGQDVIPAEFYKKLEEVITIPFKKLIEEIWENGKIPKTWTEANITLIHKPQREQNKI